MSSPQPFKLKWKLVVKVLHCSIVLHNNEFHGSSFKEHTDSGILDFSPRRHVTKSLQPTFLQWAGQAANLCSPENTFEVENFNKHVSTSSLICHPYELRRGQEPLPRGGWTGCRNLVEILLGPICLLPLPQVALIRAFTPRQGPTSLGSLSFLTVGGTATVLTVSEKQAQAEAGPGQTGPELIPSPGGPIASWARAAWSLPSNAPTIRPDAVSEPRAHIPAGSPQGGASQAAAGQWHPGMRPWWHPESDTTDGKVIGGEGL